MGVRSTETRNEHLVSLARAYVPMLSVGAIVLFWMYHKNVSPLGILAGLLVGPLFVWPVLGLACAVMIVEGIRRRGPWARAVGIVGLSFWIFSAFLGLSHIVT